MDIFHIMNLNCSFGIISNIHTKYENFYPELEHIYCRDIFCYTHLILCEIYVYILRNILKQMIIFFTWKTCWAIYNTFLLYIQTFQRQWETGLVNLYSQKWSRSFISEWFSSGRTLQTKRRDFWLILVGLAFRQSCISKTMWDPG